MLSKLFKHDMRALSRTMAPLLVAVACAGALATGLMRLTIAGLGHPDSVFTVVGTALAGFMAVLLWVGICAAAVVAVLIVTVRFYRSLMGDEGYLTFTLPTTAGRILWSKLLTGMVWIIFTLLAIAAMLIVFLLFGVNDSGVASKWMLEALGLLPEVFDAIGGTFNGVLVALEGLVVVLLGLAESLLRVYFAVVVGGLLAKKHKVLCAVGVFFAISAVESLLGTFGNILFSVGAVQVAADIFKALSGETVAGMAVHSLLLLNALMRAVMCTVFFLASRAMLRRRLNLQ